MSEALITTAVHWTSDGRCISSRISSSVPRPPCPGSPRPICPEEMTDWLQKQQHLSSQQLFHMFHVQSRRSAKSAHHGHPLRACSHAALRLFSGSKWATQMYFCWCGLDLTVGSGGWLCLLLLLCYYIIISQCSYMSNTVSIHVFALNISTQTPASSFLSFYHHKAEALFFFLIWNIFIWIQTLPQVQLQCIAPSQVCVQDHRWWKWYF